MHDTTSPPARRDLERELSAVQSALDTATTRKLEIEAALLVASDIEQMGPLHDDWMAAAELQTAARDRLAELQAMLAN